MGLLVHRLPRRGRYRLPCPVAPALNVPEEAQRHMQEPIGRAEISLRIAGKDCYKAQSERTSTLGRCECWLVLGESSKVTTIPIRRSPARSLGWPSGPRFLRSRFYLSDLFFPDGWENALSRYDRLAGAALQFQPGLPCDTATGPGGLLVRRHPGGFHALRYLAGGQLRQRREDEFRPRSCGPGDSACASP